MRIINKKYLLIILLVGVILTGVIVLKPKEKVELDNVILKQEINNKAFAMYKEEGKSYVPVEGTKFPEMYVLNLTESKCIDNNGNEIKDALSYENDHVVLKSNKSSYCYLYFDKSLGLEIKEKTPKGLSIDKVRGAMYRFQGQARDENGNELVDNYICFGTSDKDTCTEDTNHYMYRIIGIEASTGRVKVIKKEPLEQSYKWWNNHDEDIEFPQSNIYKAISESKDGSKSDFLGNTDYVPPGWYEKISTNTWKYGDMLSGGTLGTSQTGEGLYLVEIGRKETIWDEKAKAEDLGATSAVVESTNSPYHGQIFYYIRHNNEKWTKSFEGKVGLMYLSDYYFSVSDNAICDSLHSNDTICRTGWMHLSQNDTSVPSASEWTMSRYGWDNWNGFFLGYVISISSCSTAFSLATSTPVRPVFYINASEQLLSGEGTITEPFIIKF